MPRITECLAQRQEVAPETVEEVSEIIEKRTDPTYGTDPKYGRWQAEEKSPAHPGIVLASVSAPAAQVPILSTKTRFFISRTKAADFH